MTGSVDPYVDALQAALAGEHAAVWASGRAAGELAGTRRQTARRELDAHRRARDALRARITSLGVGPVRAAPAYVEPFPVEGAADGRRLMAHVNTALAATYADLAAAAQPAARREAIASSTLAGVRAVEWGGPADAFPGEAQPSSEVSPSVTP